MTETHRFVLRVFLVTIAIFWLYVGHWTVTADSERVGTIQENTVRASQSEIIEIESVALTDRSGSKGHRSFTLLSPEETGIDFRILIDEDHTLRKLYEIAFAGAGVCIGDYDNDGRPDIFLTHHARPNRLYRQVSSLKFEDVTVTAGVGGPDAWSAGATFVDVNNDGLLDLYVCNYNVPNSLYINKGDGTFAEHARSYGVDFAGASVMAAFADYDRDGDLDMYLLTSRLQPKRGENDSFSVRYESGPGGRRRPRVDEHSRERFMFIEKPNGRYMETKAGQRDYLYRNNDDGTFAVVNSFLKNAPSARTNVDDNHMGMGVVWWDFNDDGWPDLYVANDFFGPDHLYRNNKDGTFTDIAISALPHTPWFSMGVDFSDINNDGLLDLLASDMSATTHYMQKVSMGDMDSQGWFLTSAIPRQYMRNALYFNTGSERFMEVAYLAGLASTDWTWSVKFGDLDNDGFTDLFVSNGMVRNFMDADVQDKIRRSNLEDDYWNVLKEAPPKRDINRVFRNKGGLEFTSMEANWGLNHQGMSFGAALGDLDRDGDLDLVVSNLDDPVSIYRNDVAHDGSILIRLKGTKTNKYGIDTRVKIVTDAGIQVRALTLARGFMSANEPIIHLGTGKNQIIRELTVKWGSGHIQSFNDLAINQLYTITESASGVQTSTDVERLPTFFKEISKELNLRFQHQEAIFDDFRHQPLLPYKLSQMGPGLAVGDADGDGDNDLFVGGAAYQSGVLFLRQDDGTFVKKRGETPWSDHEEQEDMAPLWLDADSDGDLDLYVTSGSVEYGPNDSRLRDRLYINHGGGAFAHASESSFPDTTNAGGVITAGDFDNDGDLDLFVGSRVIPHQYPLPPSSQLLRNDGGSYTDVTRQVAPSLEQVGMVTGAIWSDVNNNGRLDLLITVEWGPIHYFKNNGKNQLVNQTQEVGLNAYVGWWNSITSIDVDNDGDMDYVVTNVGQNTKYHASNEEPATLYCGKFGNDSQLRLVEAAWEDHTLYPIRGKSCSTNAIPSLAEKFLSFDSFAKSTLRDIYASLGLNDAKSLTANELRSGLLINSDGDHFAFEPFPRLAQASPSFGVIGGDVDADGNQDIYLVQNFYGPQPETGRMDGGVSLLLRGDGTGKFEEAMPNESGLLVSGDAKALVACDLNDDSWMDFVVTQNNGELLAFQNTGFAGQKPLAVKLRGPKGNPTAIGARVTLERTDGTIQTAELHGGSGYLSQSTSTLFFGRGSAPSNQTISVRWSNGKRTSHLLENDVKTITIDQPN